MPRNQNQVMSSQLFKVTSLVPSEKGSSSAPPSLNLPGINKISKGLGKILKNSIGPRSMSTSAATVAAPEFPVLPAVWDSQLELFLEALSSPLLLRNPASPPSALGLLKLSVAKRRSTEHRAASPPSLALVAPCSSGAGPQPLRKHPSRRWVILLPAYACYLSP